MAGEYELGLKKPFAGTAHEATVSIYYSSSCIRKKVERFHILARQDWSNPRELKIGLKDTDRLLTPVATDGEDDIGY